MLWIVRLAEKEIPQSKFFCFDFKLLDDGNDSLPSSLLILWELKMGKFDSRKDFILTN
jgi:hypothetical protein